MGGGCATAAEIGLHANLGSCTVRRACMYPFGPGFLNFQGGHRGEVIYLKASYGIWLMVTSEQTLPDEGMSEEMLLH